MPADFLSTSIRFDRDAQSVRLLPPPGKPPTLDLTSLTELLSALEDARRASPVLLTLRSGSPRHFCVGANINALETLSPNTIEGWIRAGHHAMTHLEGFPCPTIAIVDGHALGGGLELALACDFIYATPRSVFGLPEARLGFVPGWGCTRLAARIGTALAKRFLFTGNMIPAEQAENLGLVDFLGSPDEIEAKVSEDRESLAHSAPHALAALKQAMMASHKEANDRGREAELEASRNCISHPETRTRVKDFLSSRAR
jgi:enoyl-CoA hydratase